MTFPLFLPTKQLNPCHLTRVLLLLFFYKFYLSLPAVALILELISSRPPINIPTVYGPLQSSAPLLFIKMEPQKPTTSVLPGPGAFDTNSYLASPPVCYDPTVSAAAFGVAPKMNEMDPNCTLFLLLKSTKTITVIEKKRRKAALWCTVLIALLLVLSTTAIFGICKVLDPRPHV